MMRTTISEPKQSFGEQAARFSMYVPIAVFLIGCFGRAGASADKSDRSVALTLFGINMLLIVTGFVPRHRRAGLDETLRAGAHPRPAIIGVVLNGLALLLVATVFLPLMGAGNTKQQVVGTWRLTNSADPSIKQLDITFNKDDTFTFVSSRVDGAKVTITGKWVFTPTKTIGLDVEKLNGEDNPAMTGKKMGLGKVKKIDAKNMTLTTDKGEEVYQRVR
jgi:hypothetical protein